MVSLSLTHRVRKAAIHAPLLVLLHGYGSNEDDLFGLVPYLDSRFTIVSLRGPHAYPPGYGWYDLEFTPNGIVRDEARIESSAALIEQCIEAAVSVYQCDASQVFLLGFSQGAAMTLQLFLTRPEKLKAAVALSGHVPDVGWNARAADSALTQKPIFVGHGTADPVVPIAAGRDARAKLETLPVALTYRERPGMDHTIDGLLLTEVSEWLGARLI
jgi:phospholipase/carboxylesterase